MNHTYYNIAIGIGVFLVGVGFAMFSIPSALIATGILVIVLTIVALQIGDGNK